MLPRLRFATQLRSPQLVSRTLSTKAATTHACRNCSTPISSLSPVCPSCAALLPPPPANTSHFDLFAIPPSYDLDQAKLKKAFLDWQRQVHPDKFSAKEDQVWAKEWSGRVNEGFRALEGDRSRGEYLLSLATIQVSETDSVADPALLMTIMETREALDEATTEEEVLQIREQNKVNIVTTIKDLSGAFAEIPPDLSTAKDLVIQLRYLENVERVGREWSPPPSSE